MIEIKNLNAKSGDVVWINNQVQFSDEEIRTLRNRLQKVADATGVHFVVTDLFNVFVVEAPVLVGRP